jgi:SAM-dependent methyltransferase
MLPEEAFSRFEHEGWQRVAGDFDATWGELTRSFVAPLIAAAGVTAGEHVLDVACGPGYVARMARSAGATTIGVDFSSAMIDIARERYPDLEFRVGDAQELDFEGSSFDVVLMNFGVLHLARPEAFLAEALRVLRVGGRIAFTVWADAEHSPGARILEETIEAHAHQDVEIPQGPDYYGFCDPKVCRARLNDVGFEGGSFAFETVVKEWRIPRSSFLFEAERDHGVRTTARLAGQTAEILERIRLEMDQRVRDFARGEGFAIPFAAHVVSATNGGVGA